MLIATKTLQAIENCFAQDNGARFRVELGKSIRELEDAFSPNNDPFRTHLGASLIGKECERELFYSFHWTTLERHPGKQLRLFNRGHLEEARFVAMLRAIDCDVTQFDHNGKQFRLSACHGHFGGSGDGFSLTIPDWFGAKWLLEFKTHNDASFKKLVADGVELSKPVHFSQIQSYHYNWKTDAALYMGINKNNDEIHAEVILPVHAVGEMMYEKANRIIFHPSIPERIANNASSFKCKFCAHKRVCHGNALPHKTCRTCIHSMICEQGTWGCCKHGCALLKEQQFVGCADYEMNPIVHA